MTKEKNQAILKPVSSWKEGRVMGDYMGRRVTPPKGVTWSTWGPPPPCKQALISKGFILQYKTN